MLPLKVPGLEVTQMNDKLLSPEEIAEILSVSPNTVRSWLRNGTIKGKKYGKRLWRIEASELKGLQIKEETAGYQPACETAEPIIKLIYQDLESLNPSELAEVYNYVRAIKTESSGEIESEKGYMRARGILKEHKESLSSEVIKERREE